MYIYCNGSIITSHILSKQPALNYGNNNTALTFSLQTHIKYLL